VVKLLKYIFHDSATRPVRGRAVGLFAAAAAVLVLGLAVIPVSHGVRAPCVIQPVERQVMRAEWPGFVSEVRARDGERVRRGDVIVVMRNEELEFDLKGLASRIEESAARLRMLQTSDVAGAQAEEVDLARLRQDQETLRGRLESLTFRAPFDGQVIAPELEHVAGKFEQLGDVVCEVASLERLRVVAAVDTADIAGIPDAGRRDVRIKFRCLPGQIFVGAIEREHPSATYAPPPVQLTSAAGGPILLDPHAQQDQRTLSPWYRVDVTLKPGAEAPPVGAAGTARFVVGYEPIGRQLWTAFRQMLHRRFLI
jgi:putative peptide zinc metalloprotease protein